MKSVKEALHQEVETFKKRTPKSHAAHERAKKVVPLGVGSNFRAYDPYPLFISKAKGGRIWDLDGNEYLDFNLCFGTLITGHCHPKVADAIRSRMDLGTMWGMPDELTETLAKEIVSRFPVDLVRFSNSGSEATMNAIRLARAYTGRPKFVKMEGAFHGGHDAVLVSFKPSLDVAGDAFEPKQVPASEGIPQAVVENTLAAQYNDLKSLENLFKKHPEQIAAVIVEPIMMNIGVCMPEPGYLEGVQDLCRKNGALFIMDEVKTGAKLARGGSCEYFKMKPDIITLGKAIGGGTSLAAFAATEKVMSKIVEKKVFNAGTYNTNPLAISAGIASLCEVLNADAYKHVFKLNDMLMKGYEEIVKREGVPGYMAGAGVNGALMLTEKKVKNYRDWLTFDEDLWQLFWFGMMNRGVLVQAWAWDEQWTISVAHTEADIEKHLSAFKDLAPTLASFAKSPA